MAHGVFGVSSCPLCPQRSLLGCALILVADGHRTARTWGIHVVDGLIYCVLCVKRLVVENCRRVLPREERICDKTCSQHGLVTNLTSAGFIPYIVSRFLPTSMVPLLSIYSL